MPPIFPRLETVKVAPVKSFSNNFLSRAFPASSSIFFEIFSTDNLSASFITGTTKPISVSTAMPIFIYSFNKRLSPSTREELNEGNSFKIWHKA